MTVRSQSQYYKTTIVAKASLTQPYFALASLTQPYQSQLALTSHSQPQQALASHSKPQLAIASLSQPQQALPSYSQDYDCMIVTYAPNWSVIMIVNYNPKSFIVQATGFGQNHYPIVEKVTNRLQKSFITQARSSLINR